MLLVIQPLREQVGEKILYTQDAVADWPDEELACSIKETLEELKECGEVFSYGSEDGSARLLSDILKSEFYLAIQNGSAIDSEEQEEEDLENQFKIHLREVISRFELAISKCNTEQLVGFCNYFRNSRDSIEMEDEAKRLISESFESLVFQELDKRQTAEVPTTLTETIVASEN